MKLVTTAAFLAVGSHAFSTSPSPSTSLTTRTDESSILHRRNFLSTIATTATAAAIVLSKPNSALASGGATAGKYTTIPIAKRRYYGRVQEAVHEVSCHGERLTSNALVVASSH